MRFDYIIMLSLEVWDDVWRRNQFLAREFATKGYEFDFVGPARDLSYAVRSGDFMRCFGGTHTPPELVHLRATRPVKFVPNKFAQFRKWNMASVRGHITRLIQTRGKKPLLWINDHSLYEVASHCPHAALIYDITDDWTCFAQDEATRRHTIEADAWLCKNADAVIVCSEALYESRKRLVPDGRLHLVPNGVDIEHYSQTTDPARHHLRETSPNFGYTGSLHDQRLDLDLLEEIANSMETGSIELVGPNMLSGVDEKRLRATGRIQFTGIVAYAELPIAMRKMDAMIVPHKVTSFTESLNPLKLWEYLASGKPIISTPVAGFRDHPSLVSIASTPKDFLRAMQTSLREDETMQQKRMDSVKSHTWSQRRVQISEILAAI